MLGSSLKDLMADVYNYKLDSGIASIQFWVKDSSSEIKIGYLNINGLIEGEHAEYLNQDHNLKCLDLLVVAETKLGESCLTSTLINLLSNWSIIKRYDADDGLKHMGVMLLVGKN